MEEHRNLLIPIDGAELAADLYLPATAGPHPILVSYYPYHKDDIIRAAYEYSNGYFASRGYGTMLVDFRGLGSSTGLAREAMHEEEPTTASPSSIGPPINPGATAASECGGCPTEALFGVPASALTFIVVTAP